MSSPDISQVVDASVSVEDSFPSVEGFETLLVAGYHNAGPRVMTFNSAEEVLEKFPIKHAIYRACAGAFAQQPNPPKTVKVGKRDGAPVQTIRVTPIETTPGFVYSGEVGGVEWSFTVQSGDAVADVCDDLVSALGGLSLAADPDAILTALATASTTQTIDDEANGVVARRTISPARKLTVTRSSHANQDAVTAVLTYKDWNGVTRTQNLAFVDGGGDSFTSDYPASKFVSLVIPAQSGTSGSTTIGLAAAYAVTDGTTYVEIATPAGMWLDFIFDNDTEDLTLEDRTANPATTIAADLAAIKAYDDDWYGLTIADAQSRVQILDAADWAETNGKFYIGDTYDSAVVDGGSTADVGAEMQSREYTQSAWIYHRNGQGFFPSARWFGAMLADFPGTESWAMKTLVGLPADDLSSTERAAIAAKSGNYYTDMRKIAVTLGGGTNGGITPSGRYIDLVRYLQSLNARVQESSFAAIVNARKLPMSNRGLSVIGNRINDVLKADEGRDTLRDIVLAVPKVVDIIESDRAARTATGYEYWATYNSPIQKVRIRGHLSL